MLRTRRAERPYAEVCGSMDAICRQHGYGVLGSHDIAATLRDKGFAYGGNCTVFEICHPGHAAALVSSDPQLASALPCRIAVSDNNGSTSVSLVSPAQLLKGLSNDQAIHQLADVIEAENLSILDACSQASHHL